MRVRIPRRPLRLLWLALFRRVQRLVAHQGFPLVVVWATAFCAWLTGVVLTAALLAARFSEVERWVIGLFLALVPAAGAWLIAHWALGVVRAPKGTPVTTRRERHVFVLALLAVVTALTLVGELDHLLAGLHLPGEPVAGLSAATAPWPVADPVRRGARICEAIVIWSSFTNPPADRQRGYGCAPRAVAEPVAPGPLDTREPPFRDHPNAPVTIVAWQVTTDTLLLIPGYALLFVVTISWLRRRLPVDQASIDQAAGSPATRSLLELGMAAAVVTWLMVLADLTENALAVFLLRQAWREYQADGTIEVVTWGWSWASPLVILLTVSALLKLLGLLLVVGFIVWAGVILLRDGGAEWRRRQVPPNRQGFGLAADTLITYLSMLLVRPVQGVWQALVAVRMPLLVAVLFYLLLRPAQGAEIIWRWGERPFSVFFLGLLATLLLTAMLFLTSRWLLRLAANPSDNRGRMRAALVRHRYATYTISALALLLALVGLLAQSVKPAIPLLILASIVIFGRPVGIWRHTRPTAPGVGRVVLPFLIAGSVPLLLGRAILGYTAQVVLYNYLRGLTSWSWVWLACAATLLLVTAALIGFLWARRDTIDLPPPRRPVQQTALGVLLGTGVLWAGIALLLRDPDRMIAIAPQLGTVGVVCLFLSLLTLAGASLIVLVDHVLLRPAQLFRALRLARTPVLSLLLIWLVLATYLPPGSGDDLHDIRTIARADTTPARASEQLADAFAYWRLQNCLVATSAPALAGERPLVPLVLVSSSGGGIRAAAWTATVLDAFLGYAQPAGETCATRVATPDTRSTWVFAASGVSGGSVGLATWAQELHTRSRQLPAGTIRERLEGDLLAPTLGWFLFQEFPWLFLRIGLDTDRAALLEQSWEGGWPEGDSPGIYALREREQAWARAQQDGVATDPEQPVGGPAHIPLLVLNGTSVESGCRFNGSVLDANARDPADPSVRCLAPASLPTGPGGVLAATNDLGDYLCPAEDVRLSTTAFLSARFPGISPAGHLRQCPATSTSEYPPETYVVDGGYLENSGAATILEVWLALERLVDAHNRDPQAAALIVPFLLQIDNGYNEPRSPGALPATPQFIAPLIAFLGVRDAMQALVRQAAQLEFSRPWTLATSSTDGEPTVYCTSRYLHISLLAHPGPQAQLGWLLSDVAFDDLADQLRQQEAQLATAAAWFDPAELAATVADCAAGP
jgi:hypothetical protein